MLADRCRVFYQKRHRRERVTWTVLQSIFEMIITMVSSIFVDLTKITVSKIGKFVDNDSLNTMSNEKCGPYRGSTQQRNPRILVFNNDWWNHSILHDCTWKLKQLCTCSKMYSYFVYFRRDINHFIEKVHHRVNKQKDKQGNTYQKPICKNTLTGKLFLQRDRNVSDTLPNISIY